MIIGPVGPIENSNTVLFELFIGTTDHLVKVFRVVWIIIGPVLSRFPRFLKTFIRVAFVKRIYRTRHVRLNESHSRTIRIRIHQKSNNFPQFTILFPLPRSSRELKKLTFVLSEGATVAPCKKLRYEEGHI